MLAVEAATIGAWATVATVIVYLVLALYAARQVKEARTLREQQSRPFVVAEFSSGFIIRFRVKNIGNTLARNVRITWDQWPVVSKSFADDPVWKSPKDSALFTSGIPSLAPGQEVTTLFDHFPNRLGEDLPMTYEVTVTYDNFVTSGRGKATYTDTFVLDLSLFLGLTHIDEKGIDQLVKEVEKVRKLAEKWTAFGGEGLKVSASNRDRHLARERRPMQYETIKKRWNEGGYRAVAKYVAGQIRNALALHGWGEHFN